jgi:hypothetical protein
MLRRALALLVPALLSTTTPALARKPHRAARAQAAHAGETRFLGGGPIGPLARVRGGALSKPEDRACRTWGPIGSRWRELDRYGRVVGEVRISARDYYDVSRCDELSVRRVSGKAGAGIFVDAKSGYSAPDARAWQPSAAAAKVLEGLATARQKGIVDLAPSLSVPLAERAFFFEWGASRERYAVVGGRSLLVFARRDGAWKLLFEQLPEKMRSQDKGYSAVLVTDMNGDGRPEIVVHHLEESGEWYGDSTYSLQANGTWVEIGAGIFGSTA